MSVLTKLFVVLVMVLSVLLVALVVSFAANTQNYKQLAEKEKLNREAAQRAASLVGKDLAVAREGFDLQIAHLQDESRALKSNITLLSAQLADAEARAIAEQANSQETRASLSTLIAANEQHARMNLDFSQELNQRRTAMVELQTKLIELTDRNTELEGQVSTAERQVRRFREQMTELQEQLKGLEDRVATLPPDVRSMVYSTQPSGEFEPEPTIAGRVVNILQVGDQTFVEINIGQSDLVKPNMKFLVHRDGKFLANLVITLVEEQQSAGLLALVDQPVQVGDMVQTGGQEAGLPPQ